MEGTTGLVRQDTSVNRDVVTERLERKPYFLTFFKDSSSQRGLDGIIQYDVVSNSLSFKRLPSKLIYTGAIYRTLVEVAPHAVEGLIFCKHPENVNNWGVYNIHTRTYITVPPDPASRSYPEEKNQLFCGMMVDTSMEPYTFKIVVSNSKANEMRIYESERRSWISISDIATTTYKIVVNLFDVWYFRMCHKGCMYLTTEKAEEGVSVYSMRENSWFVLYGSPFRGEKRAFLGAWNDHVFTVLHDSAAKCVTVWALHDSEVTRAATDWELSKQEFEWVEYASCSKAQYKQLMELGVGLRNSHRPLIVSIFCEEYLLIYNSEDVQSIRCLMLNLETREWIPSLPEVAVEAIDKAYKADDNQDMPSLKFDNHEV